MALLFADNSSDKFSLGSGASLDAIGTEGTLIFWGYWPSVANAVRAVWSITGATNNIICFRRGADGTTVRFSVNYSTTQGTVDAATGTLVASTWLCLVFRWSVGATHAIHKGTLTSDIVAASSSPTLGAGTHDHSAGTLTFGQYADAATNSDAMRIGPAAIFSRVLTDAECNSWKVRSGNVLSGCAGLWHPGLSTLDFSGNGNTGSVTGATAVDHPPLGLWTPGRARMRAPVPTSVTGATVCPVAAQGTLTAKGALTGATSCAATASGILTAKGALAGATTCGVTAQGALTAAAAPGTTVTSLGTGTGLTSGVHTLSITVPSSTDKLVVCVSGTHGSHTPAVDGITFNGVALTLAKAQATTSFGTEIWYLDAPDAGTHDVVVTWGSGGASDANSGTVTALAVDGAATGAPQATAGSTETSTTHQDTDVTSTTDGAVSIESSCRSFGVTGAPAEGQTERSELSDASGTGGTGGAAYEILGAAGLYSQDYDWSGSCTAVYAVAVWGAAVNVGTLAGATVCPSTAAGVLSAKGALVGATTCGATASGTLTGRCALAGATSCTTTAAGGLTGKGALTGATTAPVTAAGTLGGRAALAGATTCTTTAAGYLTAITLRGGAACWVTASGTLTGRGALAGAAACWVGAAGTLGLATGDPAPPSRLGAHGGVRMSLVIGGARLGDRGGPRLGRNRR